MISLIGFQFAGGQRHAGTKLAFQTLMQDQYIRALCRMYKVQTVAISPDHAPANANLATRALFAAKACTQLHNAVYDQLLNGRFPIVVGADHSLAIGSISAAKRMHQDTHVTWVDAHLDLNTEYTSPSGNIHGFPVAVLAGYSQLFGDQFKCINLKDDLTYIGVRDYDTEEFQLAHSLQIPILQSLDSESSLNIYKQRTCNRRNWLSFDVDALDAKIIRATGTPVGGGLSLQSANNIITQVVRSGQISSPAGLVQSCIGIDIAELNFADFCSDQQQRPSADSLICSDIESQIQLCRDLLRHIFECRMEQSYSALEFEGSMFN